MNPDACHGNKPNYIPKNEKRSQTEIRQQGFDEHANGFELKDNPWNFTTESREYKLWSEGWKIREEQKHMFRKKAFDEDKPLECPHCGMKIKVTLSPE